jgi:hypothetical protein
MPQVVGELAGRSTAVGADSRKAQPASSVLPDRRTVCICRGTGEYEPRRHGDRKGMTFAVGPQPGFGNFGQVFGTAEHAKYTEGIILGNSLRIFGVFRG